MIKELHFKDIATFLNLFLSFYSVLLLINGKHEFAASLVFFNVIVLDLLDGFIARITNTFNEFGKLLDSITDFIGSSLIVPFFIYFAYRKQFPIVAIVAAFIPLLFGVLREIIFKLKPMKHNGYFIGLPRNTAGLFIIAFVNSQYFHFYSIQILGIVLLSLVSVLQLSYWPYFGNDKKTLKVPLRIKLYLYYAIAIILISFYFGTFWETTTLLLIAYILSPLVIAPKDVWDDLKNQYKHLYP